MNERRDQDKQNDDQRHAGQKNVAHMVTGFALAHPLLIVFCDDRLFVHEAASVHGVG
jgi:hypothetical protein